MTRHRHSRSGPAALLICAGAALAAATTADGATFFFVGDDGLAAEAEMTLVNPTSIEIKLRNVSTGVPDGFDEADQMLTGFSFELPAGVTITGGTALTGPTSASVNFDVTNVGSNANVGGEWGYGNGAISGLLENFISGNASGLTLFGGPNLDGPSNPNGPQAGLVAPVIQVPLSGLGGIQNEIVSTISLSQAISDLTFATQGRLRVEFGSSAAFIEVNNIPSSGSIAIASVAGFIVTRRRRPAEYSSNGERGK